MQRLFLVGFMGCGKSSFGRRLAARLGWEFVDTDAEVERRAGMSVAEIFAVHGEERFRELEREVVDELCVTDGALSRQIVALGGGTVCRQGVMERLNGAGTTVYLRMPPSRLVRRMSAAGRARRPKIAGMDDAELRAFIENALPEREKWYKKANFVVECGGASDGSVLRMLLQHIDNQNIK